MTLFRDLDLAGMPPPAAIEELSFDTTLTELRAAVLAIAPEMSDVLALESEPAVKLLQIFAWRETLLRNLVNRRNEAVHLSTARGTDLDALAANVGVVRLIAIPANPFADPPTADVMEGDDAFRQRIQRSFEGFSTAGPSGAYEAIAARIGGVRDVAAISASPGVVTVVVLGYLGDGTPDPDVLAAVNKVLSSDTVRPLSDIVQVTAATIAPYTVDATVELSDSADAAFAVDRIHAAVGKLVSGEHRLGGGVMRSALLSALHVQGVRRAWLAAPVADIDPAAHIAPYCTDVTVAVSVGVSP